MYSLTLNLQNLDFFLLADRDLTSYLASGIGSRRELFDVSKFYGSKMQEYLQWSTEDLFVEFFYKSKPVSRLSDFSFTFLAVLGIQFVPFPFDPEVPLDSPRLSGLDQELSPKTSLEEKNLPLCGNLVLCKID